MRWTLGAERPHSDTQDAIASTRVTQRHTHTVVVLIKSSRNFSLRDETRFNCEAFSNGALPPSLLVSSLHRPSKCLLVFLVSNSDQGCSHCPGWRRTADCPRPSNAKIFSGSAASSRPRLFEVIPCHVVFIEKRILCYDMAG